MSAALARGGIDIVTRGWELPGWAGTFYPEDLPLEWRLAYYANEFPAVLVPAQLWMYVKTSQMRAWSDDVHPGFRFYLELPESGLDIGAITRGATALGPELAGLVGRRAGLPGLPRPLFHRLDHPLRLPGGSEPVACTVSRPDMNLPGTREWLESFARLLCGVPGLAVLEGPDVSADHLRRWSELALLLGVA